MKKIWMLAGVISMLVADAAWAITQRPESSFTSRRSHTAQSDTTQPTAQRNKSRDGTIRIPEDIRKNAEKLPDWSEDRELDEFLEDTLIPQQ